MFSPYGFGGYGGMPPAQSGGLDHYDPNEYKSRPPINTNPPLTPLDIYEKKEDRKTLGTIVSTALAGAAALIFIRHVQTLRAGEGFINSMFSPHSRNGLKEASRNLHYRLNGQQAKEWVHSIDKHTAFVKQMNSVKNKTEEQKIQRQKSIDELKTLLYDPKAGLGLKRHDPLLNWDPPKGWGRLSPFGRNGINWTLGRLHEGSLLHRFSQPGDVRTIVKAHRLLKSSHVNKLQKKSPYSRDVSSFSSAETLVGDLSSSASSSARTLVDAPSIMPTLSKGIASDAKTDVLSHKVTLKNASRDSIEGHFEARHSLSDKDKKQLQSEIEAQQKFFQKHSKVFDNERKHVDAISKLAEAGNDPARINNRDLIQAEAAKRRKGLEEGSLIKSRIRPKSSDEDKLANAAHVAFYKKIEEIVEPHPKSSEEWTKLYESLNEHINSLGPQEDTIKDKIELSRRLRNAMKEENK